MELSASAPAASHEADPTTVRRWLGAVLTLLLAIGIGGFAAAPASAATLVTCTGNEATSYSPGLTNTSRPVTITLDADYSACLHVDNISVSTMTAHADKVGTTTLSCTDLLSQVASTRLITWADGRTSTFTYSRTQVAAGGNLVFTFTGNITAGLYAGSTAVHVVTVPALAGLTSCNTTTGLTSLNGTFVFTITGV